MAALNSRTTQAQVVADSRAAAPARARDDKRLPRGWSLLLIALMSATLWSLIILIVVLVVT